MVSLKCDIFKDKDKGVESRVKGPAFVIKGELMAILHTVFMNYAHVLAISYDAAKLEMMCKLAEIESDVKYSQEVFDREFKEGTVEYGEDE